MPGDRQGRQLDAYAKKAGRSRHRPGRRPSSSTTRRPARRSRPSRPAARRSPAKSKVTVLVSVGQPQVVFTNGKDILRLNGATGAQARPGRDQPDEDEEDPTWAADGEHVAYTADGRVMLKDITKKNAAAVPLTPAGERVREPRVGADRGHERDRDERRRTDDDGDTDLCLGRRSSSDGDRRRAASKEPSFAIIRALHWAPGRPLDPRRRRQAAGGLRASSASCAGRVKKDKPAFSPDTARLEQGPVRDRHRHARQGRARRRRSRPTASGSRSSPTRARRSFRLWLADDAEDFAMSSAKQTTDAGLQGLLAQRQPGGRARGPGRRRVPGGRVAAGARVTVDDVRNREELNASGDDPSFQPLTVGRLERVLCPSCRRQLERGASYCGSCGTPLNGASAPLELVLGDATRVPMVSEMTIGRAPGVVARARRPVGLARARADHRRRGARGRGLLATARGWTACA